MFYLLIHYSALCCNITSPTTVSLLNLPFKIIVILLSYELSYQTTDTEKIKFFKRIDYNDYCWGSSAHAPSAGLAIILLPWRETNLQRGQVWWRWSHKKSNIDCYAVVLYTMWVNIIRTACTFLIDSVIDPS